MKITSCNEESNKATQSLIIHNLDTSLKMMSNHILDLSNDKLDKEEFDNARKLMDVD